MLEIFTEADQENVKKELDCYGYNHKLGIDNVAQSEFRKAAIYFNNAARSLHALEDYKNNKKTYDQAVELLQKIKREEEIRRNFF